MKLKRENMLLGASAAPAKVHDAIPATTIATFLEIAMGSGISSQDLRKRLGLTQSSASRHVLMLGEKDWRGNEGLRLVDSFEDPTDRRNKINFLSERGRGLAIKVFEILNPDAVPPQPDDFPRFGRRQDPVSSR